MKIARFFLPCLLLSCAAFSNTIITQSEIQKDFAFIRENIGGDAILLEAMVYEIGAPEKGIEQDLTKAVTLYGMLYQSRNPIAAYKLGMLAWQYQENPMNLPEKVIKNLDKINGLNPVTYFSAGSQWGDELRYKGIADLNGVLEGIALFNDEKTKESIQALNKREDIAKRSLSQLYTAFNYFKLKKMDIANNFLNKACNNPKIEPSVLNFCLNSKSLKKTRFED